MTSLLRTWLPVIVASVCLIGCASMSDVVASKEEGTARNYSVKSDRAWDIAMTVLRWEGAETIEEHRTEGYMLTTTSANMVTSGTLIGVWVDKVNTSTSKVTVVTKRKMSTNIATGLTESTFHDRFAQAVKIVKAGKSLPTVPPDRTD